MSRISTAFVIVVGSAIAMTFPADAARYKKAKKATVSYNYSSQITYGQRHSPRPAFVEIRDRSVSAFRGGRVDGRAFFDDQATRSSSF